MRIVIDDLEVNYETAGEGPPLILVHGGGLDLLTWEDMVPGLASDFTVYRFDMRGFGETRRLSAEPLSMARWAQDLKNFIDALAIERPVLAGWSLGGAVSVQFAATWPDVPRSIVLLGAPGKTIVSAGRAGFDLRQELIREGHSPADVIDRTFDFTRAAFSQWSRDHNDYAVEAIRAALKRNFTDSYAEMVAAVRVRELPDALLSAITCPALIVVGDEDARTPVAMAEELNIGIRRSYLKIIKNCGHYYGYEYPDICVGLIQEFASAF